MVHNYWIKLYNLDNYYCKFQLEKIDKIKTAIRALNLQGLNVTIPYKKKIIKHLDKIDKTAKRLQAVNTIHNNKGVLEGYNTDVAGFLLGLKKIKKLNKKKPAIVLGAGGAAESVVYSLHLIGVKKYLYNTNRTK